MIDKEKNSRRLLEILVGSKILIKHAPKAFICTVKECLYQGSEHYEEMKQKSDEAFIPIGQASGYLLGR